MFACIFIEQGEHPQIAQTSQILSVQSASSADRLIRFAFSFSPRIEPIAPDTIVLDIDGLERLFGPPEQLAQTITDRAAESGRRANVAVAHTAEAAIYAARGFAGITVIPAGEEARALNGLPLDLLSPTPEMQETWKRWGLKSFGDLAALPEAGVVERLGPESARLHRAARGAQGHPLIPFVPANDFYASEELEHPVELLDPLSFILAGLLNRVCASLEARGLAAGEIRLQLKLEQPSRDQPGSPAPGSPTGAAPVGVVAHSDALGWREGAVHSISEQRAGTTHDSDFEHRISLPLPLRDSTALLKLLRLDLEAHPPPAAIIAVSLWIEPAAPRAIQNSLFVPPTPEPAKLELTLARIRKLVGEENAGSPKLMDTHRPGAFQMQPFRQGRADVQPALGRLKACPTLSFRAFRPPLSAEVECYNGELLQVRARDIRGKVVSHAGPWRTSGDWWTADPWGRDEWDVELQEVRRQESGVRRKSAIASGSLYRVYRDRRTDMWYIEGSYD